MFKSTCSSSSEARRKYGLGDRALQVEDCIRRAKEIHLAIDELANSQDKALLESYGIQENNSSESDDEIETQDLVISHDKSISLPNISKAFV